MCADDTHWSYCTVADKCAKYSKNKCKKKNKKEGCVYDKKAKTCAQQVVEVVLFPISVSDTCDTINQHRYDPQAQCESILYESYNKACKWNKKKSKCSTSASASNKCDFSAADIRVIESASTSKSAFKKAGNKCEKKSGCNWKMVQERDRCSAYNSNAELCDLAGCNYKKKKNHFSYQCKADKGKEKQLSGTCSVSDKCTKHNKNKCKKEDACKWNNHVSECSSIEL